ncbi:cilia- and flagella-associated protein 251-like isoform X3 [Tripterygium wilfordii]|uniref:cilia- and flagella-associated protein 251-like isoform X3 n=1 Tax=Tripterygium wilfordii TaxID=458696 RepID=UPI0018F8451C|nr:cilia- and flagella-associated protein 251-like isoform X3 [Tripterygium wilfordii]XP_038702831.1 cilia- and flagella-associated protein 251-like isoform X3 [Tripterygium wilfordii]
MESRKTAGSGRISSRRRILRTCGVSGVAIAHHAYAKAQDLNGPIGSMAKRVAKMAKFIEPLLYALQYHSLALLSFIDDRILAVERIVETVFPPSKYVFNKIDQCVQIVEILPGKFDDATNKVYLVIRQFPLLDWLLLRVISWLNFWVSVLMEATKEKEIMVDKSCTECNVELATVEDEASKESQTYPVAETPQAEEAEGVDVTVMKSTYEEELEKWAAENTEKEDQKEKHTQQSDIGDTEKEDQEEKHTQQSDIGDTEKEDQEEKHAQQSDIGDTGKEDQEEKHAQQSDSGDTGKEDQEEKQPQQSDIGDTEKEDQEEKQPQQSDIGDTEKEDQKEEHARQSDIGDTGKKDQKEKLAQQSYIKEKETDEGGGNNESDESSEIKADILELFDAAWHK